MRDDSSDDAPGQSNELDKLDSTVTESIGQLAELRERIKTEYRETTDRLDAHDPSARDAYLVSELIEGLGFVNKAEQELVEIKQEVSKIQTRVIAKESFDMEKTQESLDMMDIDDTSTVESGPHESGTDGEMGDPKIDLDDIDTILNEPHESVFDEEKIAEVREEWKEVNEVLTKLNDAIESDDTDILELEPQDIPHLDETPDEGAEDSAVPDGVESMSLGQVLEEFREQDDPAARVLEAVIEDETPPVDELAEHEPPTRAVPDDEELITLMADFDVEPAPMEELDADALNLSDIARTDDALDDT